MAAAQDLYLQLKISEFCERCCVWKISDRHLRSPLNNEIYWCPAEISMYAFEGALNRQRHAFSAMQAARDETR